MEFEQINAFIAQFGISSVWLLWAVWERRRNARLQELRIRDLKEWVNFQAQKTVFATRINGDDETA